MPFIDGEYVPHWRDPNPPPTRRAKADAQKPVAIKQPAGSFYDLEFCLWLQRNFDYTLANREKWEGEAVFSAEQCKTMAAYMGMK
jgi:hypothetical protein